MSASTPDQPDDTALHLRTTSDASELANVRRQVETFCAAHGFDDRAVGEIGLCVNEAMANIIRHAYHNRGGELIELRAHLADDRLMIALRDWGDGVAPGAMPKEKDDPFCPGGLGLICLGRLMDQVTFTPQPRGMLLEMTRRRRV